MINNPFQLMLLSHATAALTLCNKYVINGFQIPDDMKPV